MRFTEDEQMGSDLDWFAVDTQGQIAHFTTAGWRSLPESVAQSKEDWKRVLDYFKNEIRVSQGNALISASLERIKHWPNEAAKERYLRDFLEMASKGLYSYDSLDFTNHPRPYFRVAIPRKPLRLADLPPEIRAVLERTALQSISFDNAEEISEDQTTV